jgi:hypothetical protein
LDEKSVPIAPSSASVIPPDAKEGLEFLLGGSMLKNSGESIWRGEFSKDFGLHLKIMVPASSNPQSVRLWNVPGNDPSALKEYMLFLGDSFICRGQLQPNFGEVRSLVRGKATSLVSTIKPLDLFLEDDEVIAGDRDKYGVLPIPPTRMIQIVVLESVTQGQIGLRAIQLFGAYDKVIPFPESASIIAEGVVSHCSMRPLSDPDPSPFDWDSMWTGTVTGEQASLAIDLGTSLKLFKLKIWNHRSLEDSKSVGLKRVAIRLNGTVVWCGRLKQNTSTVIPLAFALTEAER